MAVQLIHKVRDKQPTRQVDIDWSNPITRGLRDWRSAFCGLPITPVSGKIKGTYKGLALSSNGSSATGWYGTVGGQAINSANPATIFALVIGDAVMLDGRAYSLADSASYIFQIGSGESDASKLRLWYRSPGLDLGTGDTTGTVFENGIPHTATIRYTPNLLESFVDGKADITSAGTAAGTTTGTVWASTNMLWRGSAVAENYSAVVLGLFWTRALSDIEIKSISENPWQIFAPETIPLFFSTVTAQYARPTSDVSAGTWTASSGSDLFAMLDETSANDTDYIVTTGTSTCEVALGTLSDPASSSGHIVRYRISATSGGITVRLRQGTTTIATWTHASAPTSLTTYEQTLTGGEADSITDYSALRLQFEAT